MDRAVERMAFSLRIMRERRLLTPTVDDHTLEVESLGRKWLNILLERAHDEHAAGAAFNDGCDCDACTLAGANGIEMAFIDSGDAQTLGILMREAETTEIHDSDDRPSVYAWAAEREARSRIYDLLETLPCLCDCCDEIGGYGCSCARCLAVQHNSQELQDKGVFR